MQRDDHKRDLLYLDDIVEAAGELAQFTSGRTEDEFVNDAFLRSAVMYQLVIIGEAVANVSSELKTRHPDVPWRDVVGFRNIAVHHYFGVRSDRAWRAATMSAPTLRQQVTA